MSSHFSRAITRKPAREFSRGITTAELGDPDFDLVLEQYAAYVSVLERLGIEVIELEALAGFPDAYFVEDTAVITPEVAVITNPGAAERRGEEDSVEAVIRDFRPVARIAEPGTVDGGDVLQIGTHFFIGLSRRTNTEGCAQLGGILERYGYTWSSVSVTSGPHLKSSVNCVGDHTLLLATDFCLNRTFHGYDLIVLDRREEYAGNSLLINDHILMPAGFPRTREKLKSLGRQIIELDMSEVRKMDGGLTCLSLRF